LFVAGSDYLDSDAVFGMKESLVAQFERHPAGVGPNGERMETPFYTVNYQLRSRGSHVGRYARALGHAEHRYRLQL
jgi:hydroxyquinol 1,2-dioxygenase